MTQKIYKIVTPEQWQIALDSGVFEGAPVDMADGFIHFSTQTQVEETAQKHFQYQGPLLLISFDVACFDEALKWEPSRGGNLFPHLYAVLDPSLAVATYLLAQRDDGFHDFPEQF